MALVRTPRTAFSGATWCGVVCPLKNGDTFAIAWLSSAPFQLRIYAASSYFQVKTGGVGNAEIAIPWRRLSSRADGGKSGVTREVERM